MSSPLGYNGLQVLTLLISTDNMSGPQVAARPTTLYRHLTPCTVALQGILCPLLSLSLSLSHPGVHDTKPLPQKMTFADPFTLSFTHSLSPASVQ